MKSKLDIWYRYSIENPAAPLDRCYRLAKACCENGLRPPFREASAHVILRYLRQREIAATSTERAELRREYRDLIDAFRLQSGRLSSKRPTVEAYVLAAESDESVGAKVGLRPNVIHWFRVAFFDIEEMRKAPIRIIQDVIGISEGERQSVLDESRLRKLVGYLLKGKALDCLLWATVFPPAGTSEEVAAWASRQTRLIASLKQLTAAHVLDVRNHGHLHELNNLVANLDRADRDPGRQPLNDIEEHISAYISQIPWSVGSDAEEVFQGTQVGKWDESGVELRDDEVQLLAAGVKVPGLEEVRNLTIPPPRRRQPNLHEKFVPPQ